MKILIVRISALGDIILTLPVLEVLKQQFPTAQIDWAVSEEGAPLLENHPYIHSLHVFPKFHFKNFFHLYKKLSSIQTEHYDLVIDCQGLLKSGVITAFSGAETRIGFKSAREFAWLAYNKPIAYSPLINHQKPFHDSLFALTDALGCKRPEIPAYILPSSHKDLDDNGEKEKSPSGQGEIIIAIAPFTKWKSKDWPIEYWQTLITKITDTPNTQIWVLGSTMNMQTPEMQSLLKINNKIKAVSLPLKQLMKALQQVRIVISGDSFPLHLAGAIGVKHIIGLYGSTSSFRTHPPLWRSDFKAILAPQYPLECQPCHRKACHVLGHPCMSQILPEAVWSHIQPLVKQDLTV